MGNTFLPIYVTICDAQNQPNSVNIPVTSTEVDVTNWLQQVESKFKFKTSEQTPWGGLKKKEKEKDNQDKP